MRQADTAATDIFFNRELSWLDFNGRVLEEAQNQHHPLLERLKFLAIFSNNLDEFFMIHIPGMRDRSPEENGLTSERAISACLEAIQSKLEAMLAAQSRCYQEVITKLGQHDVRVIPYDELHGAQKDRLKNYFDNDIFPILTPLAVDPGHPFPYISNLSISLAVVIFDPDTKQEKFARVKVPGRPVIPRLIPIVGQQYHYVLAEQVLSAHVGRMFPGMEVRACYPFRVTRDADLEIQDNAADDLMELIEGELNKRRFGEVTRLELCTDFPDHIARLLMEEIQIGDEQTYRIDGPLNLSDFFPLTSIDREELKDQPFVPGIPEPLRDQSDMFAVIRQGDVMLHHPFQSFGCVTDFLRRAADDENVLAIKHTLYRTSGDSPILEALIDAAEAGKQVVCLVELKARFDEANNITWAKHLEKAGVHVVYGLIGLKTHCKVTLVVRRDDDGIRRYLHIGTGNYNPKTAAVYTDIGILTCNLEFGKDATDLFNVLTGYSKHHRYNRFLVAPRTLRKRLTQLIDREIELTTPERPGRIVAKMNSLVDPPLIRALYKASQHGVKIDLIVRGMCCLRPGLPGLSENIRVISIVGRFLEHSRIFAFNNAGSPEVYIGSADWMTRNLDRRVEVVVPVMDPEINRTLRENVLQLCLEDNCQAWELQADGCYIRRHPGPDERPISSQAILLERLSG